MTMDLSKIRYFLEAARLNNFTQAARNCHIAQTTMTKYITHLERDLGCTLFYREHRGVSLMAEGRRFYEGMKGICRSYEALRDSLRRKGHTEIRLGMAMQEYVEALWLRRFEEAYPEYKLYFSFDDAADLERHLAAGLLDGFVFSDAQSVKDSFTYRPLFAIRQSFVCANSLWERYGDIEAVIGHTPFVTKSDSQAYVEKIRKNFRQAFHQDFEEIHRCKNLSEQLLTVSMSQGFAVLPLHQGDAYPGLRVIPLADAFTEYAVLAYRQDGMTEALQCFLSFFAGMP